MTFTRLFRNSLGVATLAGFTLAMPLVAQAQVQPYNPNDPYGSPAAQQAQQDPQYAAQQGNNTAPQQYGAPQQPQQYDQQYGAPDQQGGAPQYGAPQPGEPQGIEQAPPAIPDYAQPPAPADGDIWTPGYWAWTADGYQWVQGAWVAAPYTGALWTPGYWGYNDGYFWNAGYWGPYVGYYGGINYGFGYFGIGFYGGYWGGGRFYYNRAYCNVGRGWGGGNFYNHAYNGYSGHPGGASFTRVNSTAYRGGNNYAAARGSNINGRSFAQSNVGRTNTGGFGDHSVRATNNVASNSYNGARSYNGGNANRSYSGGNAYSGASRSYAQPAQSHGSYASAPRATSYSGGSNYGGGSHGGGSYSGGGGGGSHGGGGGGHR